MDVCANLGFSREDPIKDAFNVGLDVLGVLATRYHSYTPLHIPLQAHLQVPAICQFRSPVTKQEYATALSHEGRRHMKYSKQACERCCCSLEEQILAIFDMHIKCAQDV